MGSAWGNRAESFFSRIARPIRYPSRIMIRFAAALATVLLATAPVPAQADADPVVEEVVDGDTVVLDRPVDGALQVRLVGLQAPKLPLGRPNFPVWPLAAESKRALEDLVLGKPVELRYGGRRMDRHGRLLAHLHGPGGIWVQGEMLGAGMARVYSFPDNRWKVAEMLAIEGRARAAGRGIWGDAFYAVRNPAEAARHMDTFQLVEGRVLDAAKVKGRVYLNFGIDWRTDFTVSISARPLRLFTKSGIDALALEGRVVRARGWLKRRNGPMIEATHPEQIELAE
jgi:micrococcal nuclease